jgi:hypothetical protein
MPVTNIPNAHEREGGGGEGVVQWEVIGNALPAIVHTNS